MRRHRHADRAEPGPGQGVTREVMADVLQAHVEGLGTITPTTDGRITKLP